LKCAEDRDDFSVSMKLETYPNRDSLVFQERFGMHDCETFIRGTIRFTGFSAIISAFHDIGLTSDDPCDPSVKTLRDLLVSRIQGAHQHNSTIGPRSMQIIDQVTNAMSKQDQSLMRAALGRVDFSFLKDSRQLENAIKNILKTMIFLGFLDPNCTVSAKDKDGKSRPCLDVLGDVMGKKLALNDFDRDLVVMRHVFHLMDPSDGKRWAHTSTMVASGKCKADRGDTIMSTTVGVTAALGARLVLDKKIASRGVLSPMTKDIYDPILKELDKQGIGMLEESENPLAHAKMLGKPHNMAKM